jgi:Kef-type K+ transport system membrane component KefB
MSHHDVINILVAIGTMLLTGRVFGESFRKLKMPLVVGELVAGILLGPTVLGQAVPHLNEIVFTTKGDVGLVLNGVGTISVIMLLFVAGMEVELSVIRQQGATAFKASVVGLAIPLVMGFFAGRYLAGMLGETNPVRNLPFSLFIATAMSISSLPVIARTLMDMNLFKTKVGMIIIAAAMFDDVVGWIMFSVILGMINNFNDPYAFLTTLGFTLTYAILMLSVGRFVINRSLPWAKRNLSWPGGVLAVSFGLAFLGAAFTEKIGIHAIFGAFVVGIAFGDSVHLNEKTREIIHQFVTNIFAPLFFVAVGFKINFVENFDVQMVLLVLGLAITCKLIGAGLGGLWGGLSLRESLAVGFGMNARGAMEILLGTLALQAGLISAQLFVALIVMAVVTSVLAGPMLGYLLTGEMKVGVKLGDILKAPGHDSQD